jgi:hypothetical protein
MAPYVQQRDSERRALDDRKTALMAGSIAPGSALTEPRSKSW